MAIEWCDYVDGTTISPKLPVNLRNYHPTMLANQFIRAQTQSMVSSGQEQQFSKLFDTTASGMHTSERNLSFMSSSSSIGQSVPFFNVSRLRWRRRKLSTGKLFKQRNPEAQIL